MSRNLSEVYPPYAPENPEFDTVTANEGYIDTVYLRGDNDTVGSVRIISDTKPSK